MVSAFLEGESLLASIRQLLPLTATGFPALLETASSGSGKSGGGSSGTAEGSGTAKGSAGTAAQPESEQPAGQPAGTAPPSLSPELRQRLLLCLAMAARADYLCPDNHPSRYEAWEHLINYTNNGLLGVASLAEFFYDLSDSEEEEEQRSAAAGRRKKAGSKQGRRRKQSSKSKAAGKVAASGSGGQEAPGNDSAEDSSAEASGAAASAAQAAAGSSAAPTAGADSSEEPPAQAEQPGTEERQRRRASQRGTDQMPDAGETADMAQLLAAHCCMPGLGALSETLWRYAAACKPLSTLGGARLALKSAKSLQQEARRQAFDSQLQLLAADQQAATEGQLQPTITAHQLQHALCCQVVAAASRLLNRPEEGRPIHQRPPALPPAVESELLAAAGYAAKLLTQLEPLNPHSWNVAAAAAGLAGRPQLAAENALQCFRLGQAQGCDYYVAAGALGSTVLAGTCGPLLGRALLEAAVAAFPHAQPALHRAK